MLVLQNINNEQTNSNAKQISLVAARRMTKKNDGPYKICVMRSGLQAKGMMY